jgi:hypothetical protein
MWCELSLLSYLPSELEEGMLFVNRISVGVIEPYIELWELEEIPDNIDDFLAKNGAPVKLFIIDEDENVIAVQEDIGWFDEGDHTDELREVTLNDINYILREFEGILNVEVDDEEEDIVILDDRIIISFIETDEEEE